MKLTLQFLLLIFAAALLGACAGPVKDTGYLDDYTGFNRIDTDQFKLRVASEEDRTLDSFFPPRHLDDDDPETNPVSKLAMHGIEREEIRPVLFVVGKPVWDASHRYTPEKEDAVMFVVRERMYRYLLRQYPHPVRVRYAYVPNDPRLKDYRVLSIETRITDINPGAGWLRYLIGYGAGTSVLQLEGRIYEGDPYDPKATVAEFAIREEHAAYPNGYMNPTVMKSSYTLKYAAEQAIGLLTESIRKNISPATLAEGVEPPQEWAAVAPPENGNVIQQQLKD